MNTLDKRNSQPDKRPTFVPVCEMKSAKITSFIGIQFKSIFNVGLLGRFTLGMITASDIHYSM